MRVRYSGLRLPPPLLERKGLALSYYILVRAAVSAQAPQLPVFGDGLSAHNFLGRAGVRTCP